MSSALRLCTFADSGTGWRRGALAALSAARPAPKTDPLPEAVSRPVARCSARARDGDGGEGKRAGGPLRKHRTRRSAAASRAEPSASNLTGPLNLVEAGLWSSTTRCGAFLEPMISVRFRPKGWPAGSNTCGSSSGSKPTRDAGSPCGHCSTCWVPGRILMLRSRTLGHVYIQRQHLSAATRLRNPA